MKHVLRIAGIAAAVILCGVLIAWWWWLRWPSGDNPNLARTLVEDSLAHDGLSRSWVAYIPESESAHPALVVVLHGSNGDAGDALRLTHYRFNELAERHGFIVVYPNGWKRYWNGCRASAGYPSNREDIDDVGFVRELVGQMEEAHGVDPSRVFITGISNGGHMTYRMGLEAPDEVAAIAPLVASLPVESNLDCEPRGEPVPTLIMNGTEDPINPYEGGLVRVFDDVSRGHVVSSLASARYWARVAGYEGPGVQERWPDRDPEDGTTVISTSWNAAGHVPVVLVTIEGGGHTIPHPRNRMPRILGKVSRDIDAAEVIWNFFDSSGGGVRTSASKR